ncbi:DUF1801 domain-containing protein [Pedobacter sp. P351]|uniref:iron chaperone n=1 Tax=Pedobacter superstes TaxID=3133441 RepID=UPI00309A7F5E
MITSETNDIDKYISGFPAETQILLKQLRATIKSSAPEAEEVISYAIPTFKLKGNLVHFAGYKNHIGFYPGSSGIEKFKQKLSVYKSAKGSVQFPISEPLPIELIKEIVKFRMKENEAKEQEKQMKKGQ